MSFRRWHSAREAKKRILLIMKGTTGNHRFIPFGITWVRTAKRGTPGPAASLIPVIAVAVFIGFVLVLGRGAAWLAGSSLRGLTSDQRANEIDRMRGYLIQAGAGVLAVGALLYTALNFRLAREGHVTDRYTKAIEQLGSERLDVRLGAIYALERIMIDSARDHPTVVEVLAAFIREHSSLPVPRPSDNGEWKRPAPETDVQAATTVLGRRPPDRPEQGPINLRRVNLAGVDLTHANLAGSDLTEADLSFSYLNDANLTRSKLGAANLFSAAAHGANLQDADLGAAKLIGIKLTGANLARANLGVADMGYATLAAANLAGSILYFANLTGADLTHANLSSAILDKACLNDAVLDSVELTEDQRSRALAPGEPWPIDNSASPGRTQSADKPAS